MKNLKKIAIALITGVIVTQAFSQNLSKNPLSKMESKKTDSATILTQDITRLPPN